MGWQAQLRRSLPVFGGAAGATRAHQYTLPVVNVRPDAAASLVYRVAVAVPAYAAPGAYDLSLHTVFGELVLPRSVVVLSEEQPVRLARLPSQLTAAALPQLASLPVDVWLADAVPAVAPAQPVLVSGVAPVALRIGAGLAVSSVACSAPASFAQELALVLAGERRTRMGFDDLPASSAQQLGIGEAATPQDAPVLVQRPGSEPASLQLTNLQSHTTGELSLLLPVGHSLRVVGAQLRSFPAVDVSIRHPDQVVVHVLLPPAASAQLDLLELPTGARPQLEVQRTTTAASTLLRVVGAPAGSRVAFDLGFARTAWVQAPLRTSFLAPGVHPIAALLLGPQAEATALHAELWVEPRRPPTCAVGVIGQSRTNAGLCLLFAAGLLLKRRGALPFGNRLRWARGCSGARSGAFVKRDAPRRVPRAAGIAP